jgi:lipid-binding SYLF domain-containing protein
MGPLQHITLVTVVVSLSVVVASTSDVCAVSRAEMRRETRAALNRLYSISPAVRHPGKSARAVLVFPNIVTAGSNFGAQDSYGTLFSGGRAIGYYKSVASSYSVPKGVQKFGYALLFMSDVDLAQLRKSGGWKIGTGSPLTPALINRSLSRH